MRWDGDTPLGTSDIMERRDPTPDRPYGEMWMLPQWRTMEILGAHLAELGTQIDFNSELTGLTRDEHGVTATVRHPDGTDEPIRARYSPSGRLGRRPLKRHPTSVLARIWHAATDHHGQQKGPGL
ncbi:FAD-dependent monooxygenase [Streptomyces sp. NBC_00365]|uniref:FAD-dependent monooxygenase n=1 Tax=Streptomyces sp. NBC_00365 TaxID=2975726 RepID=UPI00225BDB2A|nr:FAD-dependent monooxygenase [Streptomyces sp. NBC_00365]MCX5091734.1 FAD-dependent monooxygenase [Streptomyces sp. NBC_00365]